MHGGFVAAVGALIRCVMEWGAAICRRLGAEGTLVGTARQLP